MYIDTKNNISVSGLYSTISNNACIEIQKNCLSTQSKHLGLAINSNVNYFNNIVDNIHSRHKVTATANSKIYIQDYHFTKYQSNLEHNSVVNFPELNKSQIFDKILSSNTHGTLNFTTSFSLTIIRNNIEEEITSIQWSRQLVNDGTCFLFFKTSDCNDIVYPYKILSFNINQDNLLDQINLDNILNFIPKDLHQAKLCIKIKTDTKNLGLIYKLENYYNGKIQIFNDNNQVYTNSTFNIQNCETVQINNLYLNNNYFSKELCAIGLNNINSVVIKNSFINNNIDSKQYKTYINSLPNLTYKISVLSNLTNLYKYGVLIKINTSNVVFLNNNFNNKCTNTNYKNSIFIIAYKNSNIVSLKNKFFTNTNTAINKRPILFYSAFNSKIIAQNDYISFDSKNLFELNNNFIPKNQVIYKSVNYGYALPGAIFNHNHSNNILTKNENTAKSRICNDLPIGSIFYILNSAIQYFPDNGAQYSTQLIGYKQLKGNEKMRLGLSLPNNISKQKEIYTISANFLSTQFNTDSKFYTDYYLFPSGTESTKILHSKYCQNLFYFQKYYSTHKQGELIYIDQDLNINSLTKNTSSIITNNLLTYKDFYDLKLNNENINVLTKYSMFTHYPKESIITVNDSSVIRNKIQDDNI